MSGRWPGDDQIGVNTDLHQLVAAAADLCRKPFRHAVVNTASDNDLSSAITKIASSRPEPIDLNLRLIVRSPDGERLPEEDLELEIYRSGDDLHLTLAWLADETRPMLWQGHHPVWMDGVSGSRCERPAQGMPLEALARRLRALLAAEA